jgi:hypothetical protein
MTSGGLQRLPEPEQDIAGYFLALIVPIPAEQAPIFAIQGYEPLLLESLPYSQAILASAQASSFRGVLILQDSTGRAT